MDVLEIDPKFLKRRFWLRLLHSPYDLIRNLTIQIIQNELYPWFPFQNIQIEKKATVEN